MGFHLWMEVVIKVKQTEELQVTWGMLLEDFGDIYEWVNEFYQIIDFSIINVSL